MTTNPPSKMGRPSSFDKIDKDKLKELYLDGKTDAEVAEIFGVTRRTVWNWRKKHPELKLQPKRRVRRPIQKQGVGFIKRNYVQRGGPEIPKTPLVYGVFDYESGHVVYVGKTKNLSNRIYAHVNTQHNVALAEWMAKTKWSYTVLEMNPPSLDKAEFKWIEFLRDQLFNMVNGEERNWEHPKRQPWSAGTGIKCPSELMMFYLKHRRNRDYHRIHRDIKFMRDGMSVKQRCLFELSVCMDHYHIMTDKHEKWLAQTEPRLLAAIGGGADAR